MNPPADVCIEGGADCDKRWWEWYQMNMMNGGSGENQPPRDDVRRPLAPLMVGDFQIWPRSGGDSSNGTINIGPPSPHLHPSPAQNQRPYNHYIHCRHCHEPNEVLDGVLPSTCADCGDCVLGTGCGGGHPPIIPNLKDGYHAETKVLIARTVRRLLIGQACYWDEVMDFSSSAAPHSASQ